MGAFRITAPLPAPMATPECSCDACAEQPDRPVVQAAIALEDEFTALEMNVSALEERARKAEKALYLTEQLYGSAVKRIFELYDQRDHQAEIIDEREGTIRYWEQQVDLEREQHESAFQVLLDIIETDRGTMNFLMHSLERYAEHVWNDIRTVLKGRGVIS